MYLAIKFISSFIMLLYNAILFSYILLVAAMSSVLFGLLLLLFFKSTLQLLFWFILLLLLLLLLFWIKILSSYSFTLESKIVLSWEYSLFSDNVLFKFFCKFAFSLFCNMIDFDNLSFSIFNSSIISFILFISLSCSCFVL